MSEIVQLDGPVPAFYRITTTAHGLTCPRCASSARMAAVHARLGGAVAGSAEEREPDGLIHFATVTRCP